MNAADNRKIATIKNCLALVHDRALSAKKLVTIGHIGGQRIKIVGIPISRKGTSGKALRMLNNQTPGQKLKNIEITGLPGAGKSTLVNKIIKNNPDIFYDKFDLAIKPYKKFSNKRKLLNLAFKLINLNSRSFWYNQDAANEQDQFSKNYPDFYGKAWDNFKIIIQSGFVPSSFWMHWYFNAWLSIALASKRDNIFLNDEGISQRLLQVLAEKDLPDEFIIKYFDCVDLVIVYDQSFKKALQQACMRDGQIRSKTETKILIETHKVGIERLKKYALKIEKIKIVKPEEITDIFKGIRYAPKNN